MRVANVWVLILVYLTIVGVGLGSFLLLTPKAVLICVGIFVGVIAVLRWVALGSVVASASLPPLAWLLGEARQWPGSSALTAIERLHPVVWLAAGALLIVTKHHANLRRMLAGAEPRFQLFRNK